MNNTDNLDGILHQRLMILHKTNEMSARWTEGLDQKQEKKACHTILSTCYLLITTLTSNRFCTIQKA